MCLVPSSFIPLEYGDQTQAGAHREQWLAQQQWLSGIVFFAVFCKLIIDATKALTKMLTISVMKVNDFI